MKKYISERTLDSKEKTLSKAKIEFYDLVEKLFTWAKITPHFKEVDYKTLEIRIGEKKLKKIKNKLTWLDLVIFNNLKFLEDYFIQFEINRDTNELHFKSIDKIDLNKVIYY